MKRYVPDTGHVVWLNFTPQSGHEQSGRRPALVLSPASYNDMTGLMLCCPMTNQKKGYPFDVLVSAPGGGVILADQVKSLDWRSRQATRKGVVSIAELREVRAKLSSLLGGAPAFAAG